MPYRDPEKHRQNHKRYMREVWYPKNKKKHISYVNRLKQKILEYICEYKKMRSCIDCGFCGGEYPQVLEFDHVGKKSFNLADFKRKTSSLNRIKTEISRCELVCANCHRIRTVKRTKKI